MIGIQDTGPLWVLTLRRPEKANSLTRTMLETLERSVRRASAEGARAILLTGEGKVFSAGADLDEALAWGLIDRIVPPEALAETAQALAADTLAATPAHAAAIKRLVP